MNRLQLQDSRRLRFPAKAVLDAALSFDREHNGWLWRGSEPVIAIDPAGQGALTIEARPQGSTGRERVERSPAWTAAALMHYCFRRRIPIPRGGTKTLEVEADAVVLRVEMGLTLPALELQPGSTPTPDPAAAVTAPVA